MPVLVVQLLGATPFEVGEVNAVRTHLLLPKLKAPNAAVLPNKWGGRPLSPSPGWVVYCRAIAIRKRSSVSM